MVQSDRASGAGDCRIEWADGGVTRDACRDDVAIDEVVARYVAARSGAEPNRNSGDDAMSDDDTKVPLPDLENGGDVQAVQDAGSLAHRC